MRAPTLWTLTAALALGAGVASAVAQTPGPTDAPAESGWKIGWLARLFGGQKAEPQKPPAKAQNPKVEDIPQLQVLDSTASLLEREGGELSRRRAVCDKLRLIALQTGDEALMRRANELDDRAWALYQQRTAAVAVPGSAFQSDEQTLARRLGSRGGPTADAPVPTNFGLAPRDTTAGHTAARGEQP
jgi:hypothetical protein